MPASALGSRGKVQIAYLVIALAGLVNSVLAWRKNQELWYYWDELTWILEVDRGWIGLLSGHVGNFLPLGKAMFRMLIRTFGNNYEFLGLLTSILLTASALLLARLIFAVARSSSVILVTTATLITWILSPGAFQASTWGFMFIWLVPIFAFLATLSLIQYFGWTPWLLVFPVLISFLTFSSILLPLTLLAASLLTWSKAHGLVKAPLQRVLWTLVLSSLLLTGAASMLAQFVDPLDAGAQTPTVDLSGVADRISSTWWLVLALSIYWPSRMLWPDDFRSPRDGQDPTTLIAANSPVQVIVLVALSSVVFFTVIGASFSFSQESRLRLKVRSPAILLAAASIVAFVGLGMARWYSTGVGLTWISFRYDTMGILLGAVLMSLTVAELYKRAIRRKLVLLVVGLSVATAATSIFVGTHTLQRSIEPARWADRERVAEALEACRSGRGVTTPLVSTQPEYQERICDIFALVR